MSTGRSNQLLKQVGEYLVACELARRGFFVATFSGNVPDFDLIATNGTGYSYPIQVKTIKGKSWQFSIDRFAEVTFNGNIQIIGSKKPLQVPELISIFVVAAEKYGEDRFFILEWSKLQDIVIANHRNWLDSHGGIRPKKFDSLHCAVTQSDLRDYAENWDIISHKHKSAIYLD